MNYKTIGIISIVSILLGIAIAGYIYIYNFNYLSETEMVALVPFWFFPIILGYYGAVASKALQQKNKTIDTISKTVFDVAKESMGAWILPLMLLLHLPFLLVKSKNILLTAFVGALIWSIVLFIFLNHIFPYL